SFRKDAARESHGQRFTAAVGGEGDAIHRAGDRDLFGAGWDFDNVDARGGGGIAAFANGRTGDGGVLLVLGTVEHDRIGAVGNDLVEGKRDFGQALTERADIAEGKDGDAGIAARTGMQAHWM